MNDQTRPDRIESVMLDPESPWLGLSSYTEQTRAYFHGRDEEAAELARRVQRKNLTVLFGQSGLGKTSLLRAGLVPRLRDEGYCPVYVRVDYSPSTPPPAEQIKQAIFRATAEVGAWTRPGSAIEGESLWEFLHHRGDLLRDAEGRTLLPLLIFDQFEEIFTLAQADDAGRQRAKEFIDELADLVENRPPAALEARIDRDEVPAEDFDFARADYRILIALREDYLAHLEAVKGVMPSITQNRMRLARMTGAQALTAVMKPGGRLVSLEVAESIVRFVAGGSELANAEVEPSLLSLVCRELNTVRLAQGRKEISADLLAGSRDTILSEFYERALADQPPGVRRVIEDELLTESGYRESLAEERVQKALAAAGAAPDALATLVDRRLLRIEERLDMRRVELTHDVLCPVVTASRDLRHEREARDETERQLVAQREREAATRRALVRARAVAAVCAVLMVVAAASAVFGWINLHRARVAEAESQKARALAERARGDAEKLVGFLIEDFYAELEPTGRLETMGKLAKMAVKYYDGLPPELVTPRTRINRAMALVRESAAQAGSGNQAAAQASFKDAAAVFEKLRAAGDTSEDVTYGLALALYSPEAARFSGGRSDVAIMRQAADLLRPSIRAGSASRRERLLYADVLNHVSHALSYQDGVAACEEARGILKNMGALDLSDLSAASVYADTADSEARHLLALGRLDEAAKLEQEVYGLAEKVLVARPGDLRSMLNRYYAADMLARIATRRNDLKLAVQQARAAVQAAEDAVRFNPSDMTGWQLWITGKELLAGTQLDLGAVRQSMETLQSAVMLRTDKRLPSSLDPLLAGTWAQLAALQAQDGMRAEAMQSMQMDGQATREFVKQTSADDPRREWVDDINALRLARIHLRTGEIDSAFESAATVAGHMRKAKRPSEPTLTSRVRNNVLGIALATEARAAVRLGRYQDAEAAAREWLEIPFESFSLDDPAADRAREQTYLAWAIAKQGRSAEALRALQPALDHYRKGLRSGPVATLDRWDAALAQYVNALAQPATDAGRAARRASLAEAAGLIAGASPEARQLSDLRELSGWIAAAQAASAG